MQGMFDMFGAQPQQPTSQAANWGMPAPMQMPMQPVQPAQTGSNPFAGGLLSMLMQRPQQAPQQPQQLFGGGLLGSMLQAGAGQGPGGGGGIMGGLQNFAANNPRGLLSYGINSLNPTRGMFNFGG